MANTVPLLLSDAEELVLGALEQPQWGIYLNGMPVIQPASPNGPAFGIVGAAIAALQGVAALLGQVSVQPAIASTVEFDYDQDWSLPTYPQEQGGFQSYNKVTLPFDVRVRLASASGGSQSDRQAFLQTCLAVANSIALFDVQTPELVYTSCNVEHIGWRRRAEGGATLIQVDLYFKQVNEASSTTFQNTQQPGEAAPVPAGNVQAQSPTQYVNQQFSAGNWTVH